jgi:hypothetical protein
MTDMDWKPFPLRRRYEPFGKEIMGSPSGATTSLSDVYEGLLRLGETMSLLSQIGLDPIKRSRDTIGFVGPMEDYAERIDELALVLRRLRTGLRKSVFEMLERFSEPTEDIWCISCDIALGKSGDYGYAMATFHELAGLRRWWDRPSRRLHAELPHRLLLDPPKNASAEGFRYRESKWCRAHAADLKALAGQWVVLEGEKIIAHGTNPGQLIAQAREQGTRIPYVFHVEEENQKIANLGL